MVLVGILVTCGFFAGICEIKADAQTADSGAQSASQMPTDPQVILDSAAKLNGLSAPGVLPWHIKATYQAFAEDGKPPISGSYEEFWISEKKFKRSYSSQAFSQTDFGTELGLYRSGRPDWPNGKH